MNSESQDENKKRSTESDIERERERVEGEEGNHMVRVFDAIGKDTVPRYFNLRVVVQQSSKLNQTLSSSKSSSNIISNLRCSGGSQQEQGHGRGFEIHHG